MRTYQIRSLCLFSSFTETEDRWHLQNWTVQLLMSQAQYLISCKCSKVNILNAIKRRKVNFIGHILHQNCLIKRVIE